MDTLIDRMKARREKLQASLDLEMAARGRTFIAMDFESRMFELDYWINELKRRDAMSREEPAKLSVASGTR